MIINSIEALLFGAGRPIRLSEIKNILENTGIKEELPEIKKALNELEKRYEGTSIEIKEDHSSCLNHLWNEKTPRVSKALMETISIIAFKQPVTRGDIEDIRGVSVSTRSIRSLLERNWIKVSGFRDVPGRPALYVTTKDFLDDLNLKSISDLPALPDIQDTDDQDVLSQVI